MAIINVPTMSELQIYLFVLVVIMTTTFCIFDLFFNKSNCLMAEIPWYENPLCTSYSGIYATGQLHAQCKGL
jgi:hypothetical protein